MKKNKTKYLILLSFLLVFSISLVGCGKKEENKLDLNLPVESKTETSELSSIVESTSTKNESEVSKEESTTTTESSKVETETEIETSESSTVLEPIINKEDISSTNTYKTLFEEQKKLKEFQYQLNLLLEDDLRETYADSKLGMNISDIVDILDSKNFRYINNVTLSYLYDESGNLLNMDDRKGMIVFPSSEIDIDEELQRVCNKINYEAARSMDIKIDARDCEFDSYIIYTFNDEGLLIGKFKYLQTEENPLKAKVDLNILGGSLSFSDKYKLVINEDAENKEVYEKLDEVRTLIKQYDKDIEESFNICFKNLKDLYDNTTNQTTSNEFGKKVLEVDLGIEKMPASSMTKYNQKYLNTYTNGYYVYMSIDEEETSPDMRYDNYYLVVIFDNNDNMYYIELVSKEYNDIKCKDEKNADDYSFVELYKLISNLDKSIASFDEDKKQFNSYLNANLHLLNKNINYEMSKEDVLKELDKTGLEVEKEYENLIVSTAKDKDGATISLVNDYEENLYDSCAKVSSQQQSIFYFFRGEELIGIYRSDYMDVHQVDIQKYYNLTTINKGLNQLKEKEQELLLEKKTYVNMVNKKITDFMSNIGYADNHAENQIYKKNDIIKALSTTGITYEEGMNKGDGLYFIGIYALDTDTKYAHKIYFDINYEVALIQ